MIAPILNILQSMVFPVLKTAVLKLLGKEFLIPLFLDIGDELADWTETDFDDKQMASIRSILEKE